MGVLQPQNKTEFLSAPSLPIFAPRRKGGPGRPGSTVTTRGRAWSRSETLQLSQRAPPGEHTVGDQVLAVTRAGAKFEGKCCSGGDKKPR